MRGDSLITNWWKKLNKKEEDPELMLMVFSDEDKMNRRRDPNHDGKHQQTKSS